MTDKDKENQDELFIFDSKEMEKLASYDPPIEQLRKEKKEVKKKIKEERKEVMRIATTPMQIPKPTLRQIPEQPFSSEEEILKAIISFYTIQNITFAQRFIRAWNNHDLDFLYNSKSTVLQHFIRVLTGTRILNNSKSNWFATFAELFFPPLLYGGFSFSQTHPVPSAAAPPTHTHQPT